MVALVVGEYGHWLVLLPLIVGGLAAFASSGLWRVLTLILCVGAAWAFMHPAWTAYRMDSAHFSWRRLYWREVVPRAAVETAVYSKPDGESLTLDLYLPVSVTRSSARPVLLVIHGGGWDSGDNQQLTEWNHRWVAQGWAVAALNYRLAPRHHWPAQREDVAAALAAIKSHAARFGLDWRRVVILGRSAGGQIATATAYGLHDPSVRGVIALYSPHDMRFAYGVSRSDDSLNSLKLMRQYFGGPPDTQERIELYDSASGQLLAAKNSPPALLIHGFPDTLVWYKHSRRLKERLDELGVSCTHLELPWATHAFDYNPDGPGGQLTDAAIQKFLARVVQDGAGQP